MLAKQLGQLESLVGPMNDFINSALAQGFTVQQFVLVSQDGRGMSVWNDGGDPDVPNTFTLRIQANPS